MTIYRLGLVFLLLPSCAMAPMDGTLLRKAVNEYRHTDCVCPSTGEQQALPDSRWGPRLWEVDYGSHNVFIGVLSGQEGAGVPGVPVIDC